MKVTVLRTGEQNLNGRTYSSHVANQMIAMFNKKTNLGNRMMGHLGFSPDSQTHINSISHEIKSLHMEKDIMYAEIETIDTPNGKILNELIEHDVVAFRPSSMGFIAGNGDVTISDFLTIDAILKNDDSFENL